MKKMHGIRLKDRRWESWFKCFDILSIDNVILGMESFSLWYGMGPDWCNIFGKKDKLQAIALLKRLKRIKHL